jgi:hypothetical protein
MASFSLYTKLETLPSALKEEAKNFIEYLVDKTKKGKKEPKSNKNSNVPSFGSLKGKIHLSDDFDAPLDEFKDYM